MDDSLVRRFFLEPSCASQRQYEALRAVFIEGCPQKEVAQRFDYSYGALRLLVGQLRAACAGGQPPPFSPNHAGAGRRPSRPSRTSRPGRLGPKSQRSPMLGR